MKIYVGSDHAGFQLKQELAEYLKGKGFEVEDLGAFSGERVDYPDFAKAVAEKVREDTASRGLLVCGTGIGMAIAANKVKGVRAANVHDVTEARLARAHNDATIVTVGARTMGPVTAKDVLDTFFSTDFAGGRHVHRVEKITAIENGE